MSFFAPAFPSQKIPGGLIWPAEAGRKLLAQLASEDAWTSATRLQTPERGKTITLLYRVGSYILKTSSERSYQSLDLAKESLHAMAKDKLHLESLFLAGTVLIVQEDGGSYWLWTLAPEVVTLQERLTRGAQQNDEPTITLALEAFVQCVSYGVELSSRRGLLLDLHPSNFALFEGRLSYIDDDIQHRAEMPSLVYSLLFRVDEYAAFPEAIAAYIKAMSLLCARLPEGSPRRSDLKKALQTFVPRTPAADEARLQLLSALGAPPGP